MRTFVCVLSSETHGIEEVRAYRNMNDAKEWFKFRLGMLDIPADEIEAHAEFDTSDPEGTKRLFYAIDHDDPNYDGWIDILAEEVEVNKPLPPIRG